MTTHSAWATWIHDNTIVIMLLISLGFALILWIANKLMSSYRKIAAMEKAQEDSNIDRLVKSIEKLVKRIDELFVKHDGHGVRISKLEKDTKSHFTMCSEREKLLNDIKVRQAEHIKKYDDAMLNCSGGSRKGDPPPDRLDREN